MSAERRVSVRWLGNYRTEIDVRGVHKLLGDEVEEAGGQDTGPMPTELLLASLCSCLCLAVFHIARKQRLDLGELQVHADAVKDMQAFRFQEIHLEVEADLPPGRLETLVDLAKKYCFVSNTVIQGCSVLVSTHSSRRDAGPSGSGSGDVREGLGSTG